MKTKLLSVALLATAFVSCGAKPEDAALKALTTYYQGKKIICSRNSFPIEQYPHRAPALFKLADQKILTSTKLPDDQTKFDFPADSENQQDFHLCTGHITDLKITQATQVDANQWNVDFTYQVSDVAPWATDPAGIADNPNFPDPARYQGKTLTGRAGLRKTKDLWQVIVRPDLPELKPI